MSRIGIDVGGTNTDLIQIKNNNIIFAQKNFTTPDVITGVKKCLINLKDNSKRLDDITAVMIGTTHFINAIVQHKHLNKVGVLRICLPSSKSLEPFIDWPKDLAKKIFIQNYLIKGGHEYDGNEIVPLDTKSIEKIGLDLKKREIKYLAISSVFSPLTSEHEKKAEQIIKDIYPDITITLSSNLGRIGLIERENATILNASLIGLAGNTFGAFKELIKQFGINKPLYITQNDGTVASIEKAKQFPILCIASGPTNSMRGAAYLSKIKNALVCDIGGTTSDIGYLINGFPKQANNIVDIKGVRTLFRMPELISIGLGGGTIIDNNTFDIGDVSVGNKLDSESLIFGGKHFTLTDYAVASGLINLGNKNFVNKFSEKNLKYLYKKIEDKLYNAIDNIKIDPNPLPLIVVGGGAFLSPNTIRGISEIIHVKHNNVANAVGAAISKISGEVDKIYKNLSRNDAIRLAEDEAREKAINSGADKETLEVIEQEDLPLSYLPGNSLRVKIRIVGNIKQK